MSRRRGLWAQITEWFTLGGRRRVVRQRSRGGTRRLMTVDEDMARTPHPSRRRRRRTRRYSVGRR